VNGGHRRYFQVGRFKRSIAEHVSVVQTWSSNLQSEIAFANLASKLAAATVCGSQTRRYFIVYPATGALEITSSYRHEAAETFQRVVRNTQSSFYFDLCCFDCCELMVKVGNIVLRVHGQFCSYFDKLIGVRHLPAPVGYPSTLLSGSDGQRGADYRASH
jgi:hypothetical protein